MLGAVRSSMQTLHHSLELLKSIGSILDFIFLDSYDHEAIFAMFITNEQFVKSIIQLIDQNEKLQAIRLCYSSKSFKDSSSSHQSLEVSFTYSRVFFKMLTNQN